MDQETVHDLIRKLNASHEHYIENFRQTQQLLLKLAGAPPGGPASAFSSFPALHQSTPTRLVTEALLRENVGNSEVESFKRGSIYTGEDASELDDNESWHVQQPLQAEEYNEDGLKQHLLEYDWSQSDREVLQDTVEDSGMKILLHRTPSIFPTEIDESPDRSHLTHYSIFNVGTDGSPLPLMDLAGNERLSRSIGVWNRIKSTNTDSNKMKAVGKITIVREPSPLLFAALHYTHNKHFDMDELFAFLVDDDPALCRPPNPFADDPRHQRSFVFTFEYFTIVDEGCEPMAWQKSDVQQARSHIDISRCSSVVALSLEGPAMGHVKNKHRTAKKRFGNVYDPFAPWRVLCLQAYPDMRSSLDIHDSSHHYVNGPEAFLVTLAGEFRDAAKRLTAVYKAISAIVEPPPDFIFNLATRDQLLFEDSNFTFSRRYFFAFNSLAIMNEDIEDMVLAYEEVFRDSVWNGADKVIWPGTSEEMASSKHTNWRRKMKKIRQDIESEIARLKEIETLNAKGMRKIKSLHNNLFNGTSVLESRRSVENAIITVQQGRNIRLLTLVTIFFLPLTFTTSVFGMTALPQDQPLYDFGYTCVAVCIPTYLLIGSLNTENGMHWWNRQVTWVLDTLSALGRYVALFLRFFGYKPKWATMHHEAGSKLTKSATVESTLSNIKIPRHFRHLSNETHLPRGNFVGMPAAYNPHTVQSNTIPEADENGKPLDIQAEQPLQMTTSEKEQSPLEFGRPWQPTINFVSTTGEPPPHRPSIGMVSGANPSLLPSTALPRLPDVAEESRRKGRSMTMATIASSSSKEITGDVKTATLSDDTASESSKASAFESTARSLVRKLVGGRKKDREDLA